MSASNLARLLAAEGDRAPSLVVLPMRFKFAITTLTGAGATRAMRYAEGTVLEVAHDLATPEITADKRSASLFSVGVLREDHPPGESISTKEALAGVQAVVLDFDAVTQGEVDRAQAALAKSGFVHLAYPTFSWTPGAPCWRIVVFLSRVASVERYATLWEGLGVLVGTVGDPAAKKAAQRYFVYSHPPNEEGNRPAAIVGGTKLANPDQLEALAPSERPGVVAPLVMRRFDTAVNADVLAPEREDNRNRDAGLIAVGCPMVGAVSAGVSVDEPEWRRVLGVLKFVQDGERLWHLWSAKDPRYDWHEAQRKWDAYPKEVGPTRCGASPHCGACKHHDTISSPVQLGDMPAEQPLKPKADDARGLQEAMTAGGLAAVMDTDGRLNMVTTHVIDGGSVRTVLPAESQAARDAIIAAASAGGKAPSDRAIENLLSTLRHGARQRGEAVPVYLRVAEIGGIVYVDLGPGHIARIGPAGFTMVDDLADGVPLFRRGSGAGQLPYPQFAGSAAYAFRFAIGVFMAQFGLTQVQALVTVAVMLEWHRTGTPHPILELVGPAGSGKSTLADLVASFIDPSGDGGRVTVGTAAPDIAAAAQQRHLIPLDNAGKLDAATSNLMCIVSTGGTLLVRLLYTNGDTAMLHLHRAGIFTAVSAVCTAPDLQSRVIRIELAARRTDYAAEGGLRASWAALRPKMLGALYTLLSGALRELPRVRERGGWGHRLVDLDQMGEAVISAVGAKPGTFVAAVGQLRQSMARRTASGDLFLIALMADLRKLAEKPTHDRQLSLNAVLQLNPALSVVAHEGRTEVTIRPGALHRRLPPHGGSYARDNAIPATERGLIDALRRVQPLLAGIGVDVQEVKSGSRTLMRFTFAPEALHAE